MNKKMSDRYRIVSVLEFVAALVFFSAAFLIDIFLVKIAFIGVGGFFLLCGVGFALLSRYVANH